jgi:hypothetical protein
LDARLLCNGPASRVFTVALAAAAITGGPLVPIAVFLAGKNVERTVVRQGRKAERTGS